MTARMAPADNKFHVGTGRHIACFVLDPGKMKGSA